MEKDKGQVFFVCVNENEEHIEDSILTNCCLCNSRVWISVHNADKKPICWDCFQKVSNSSNDVEVGITSEDLERSIRELLKKNKEK